MMPTSRIVASTGSHTLHTYRITLRNMSIASRRTPSAVSSLWLWKTLPTKNYRSKTSITGFSHTFHTCRMPPRAGKSQCVTIFHGTNALRRWRRTGVLWVPYEFSIYFRNRFSFAIFDMLSNLKGLSSFVFVTTLVSYCGGFVSDFFCRVMNIGNVCDLLHRSVCVVFRLSALKIPDDYIGSNPSSKQTSILFLKDYHYFLQTRWTKGCIIAKKLWLPGSYFIFTFILSYDTNSHTIN